MGRTKTTRYKTHHNVSKPNFTNVLIKKHTAVGNRLPKTIPKAPALPRGLGSGLAKLNHR